MKAKRKSDGAIIDVRLYDFDSAIGKAIFTDDSTNTKYDRSELDFLLTEPEEEVTIEGWVAKDDGECIIFPSKDQRDWKKWDKENNHKVPKTWSELKAAKGLCPKILGCKSDVYGTYDGTEKNTPIEKSALAILKIHQIIEVGYGGNLNKDGWCITAKNNIFGTYQTLYTFAPFGFHTKEQAEEFLSKPENVQLLKDYFMI